MEFAWLSTQGDITVFGAGAPSAFSSTDDDATGRLQVRAKRTERVQQPQPLETAARPRNMAFTGGQAKIAPVNVPFGGSGSRTGGDMQLTPKAAVDHAEVEEGNSSLWGDCGLRATALFMAYFVQSFFTSHSYGPPQTSKKYVFFLGTSEKILWSGCATYLPFNGLTLLRDRVDRCEMYVMFVGVRRQLDMLYSRLLPLCLSAGGGEDESGFSHLREVTSGSTPKPVRLARRGHVVQSGDGVEAKGVRNHEKTTSSLLFAIEPTAVDAGGSNGIGARLLAAGGGPRKRDAFSGSVSVGEVNCERPVSGQAAAGCSPFTPTKQSTTGSTTPSSVEVSSWDDRVPPATPVMTPTAPITSTAEQQVRRATHSCGLVTHRCYLCCLGFCIDAKLALSPSVRRTKPISLKPDNLNVFVVFPLSLILAAQQKGCQGQEPPLAIMASLYVHIMIRRFVPSLATEMHLTIRLLHVHPDVARGSSSTTVHSRSPALGQHHQRQPSSSRSIPPSPAVDMGQGEGDGCACEQPPEAKTIFKNGLDCRSFAACVLLGLKSLLPHLGTDTLDLLAGSLAVATEVSLHVHCTSASSIRFLPQLHCRKAGKLYNSDFAVPLDRVLNSRSSRASVFCCWWSICYCISIDPIDLYNVSCDVWPVRRPD